MVTLQWRRQSDMHWLPPGAPLNFGKSVILRGVGYEKASPTEFVLYRVPSPIVSWALAQRKKRARWELARRPATVTSRWPLITVDSEPVVLAPSGYFHTHRWQFSDEVKHWSPVVRTTRFSTLTTSLSGGLKQAGADVSATIKTTVATTVDPSIRIDLALPWNPSAGIGPGDVILQEFEDLANEFVATPERSEVLDEVRAFLPERKPDDVEFGWEPRELDLADEASVTFEVPIYGVSTTPFAFCFIASNLPTGETASSEVVVVWRDKIGAINLAFAEG